MRGCKQETLGGASKGQSQHLSISQMHPCRMQLTRQAHNLPDMRHNKLVVLDRPSYSVVGACTGPAEHPTGRSQVSCSQAHLCRVLYQLLLCLQEHLGSPGDNPVYHIRGEKGGDLNRRQCPTVLPLYVGPSLYLTDSSQNGSTHRTMPQVT